MPARIVLVHDDPEFAETCGTALNAAGHDVKTYTDTMTAIGALENTALLEILITRVVFPAGQPPGPSLALMARVKRPGVKVLFAGRPENREHTEGIGEFLPAPVTAEDVVRAVEAILRRGAILPGPDVLSSD